MRLLIALLILLMSSDAWAQKCGPYVKSQVVNISQGELEFIYNTKIFLINTCPCDANLVTAKYLFRDLNGDPAGVDDKFVGTMYPGEIKEVVNNGRKSHPVPIDKENLMVVTHFNKFGAC